MRFLPIAGRELRVAARRPATYRVRMLAAGVALVFCGFSLLTISIRMMPASIIGQQIFSTLSFLAFGYSLLAGTFLTADCISEEKREGTLGLLFLTDLHGYDVVIGKVVASSLNGFYGLVAILPVLALPLLLGGITIAQVCQLALVLLNTLFFSVAAGVFVSTLCRDDRRAAGSTFLVILLVAGGIPALGIPYAYYIQHRLSDPVPPWPFLVASPGYAFGLVVAKARFTRDYLISLLATQALSWLLIGLAGLRARLCWQDRPAGKRRLRWREVWERWRYGDTHSRREVRSVLLDANPVLWLTGRDRTKPVLVWLVLGLLGLAWFWGYLKWGDDWSLMNIPTAFLVMLTLKLWLASEACRQFAEDRQSSALELILSTPLTVENILQGQLLALKRQFAAPVAVVLFVDLLLLLSNLRDQSGQSQERSMYIAVFLAGMLVFALDMYALSWTGMWLGLTAKKANRAALGSATRILLLPWVVFWVLLVFSEPLGVGRNFFLEPRTVVGVWFVLALANDWLFTQWAKKQLRTQFRRLALQRYAPAPVRRHWWTWRSRPAKSPVFGQKTGDNRPVI